MHDNIKDQNNDRNNIPDDAADMNPDKKQNKENKQSDKLIRKTDIIMLILLVAAGILGFISVKGLMKKGGSARVSVDGKVVKTVSLDDEGEYRIEGKDGGYNLLIVKDGEAYLKEADCPDKLCVKQGHISKEGETIICLPHKVVIEITK